MATFVKVEGLQKLTKTLAALPPRMQKAPLRRSLSAGGTVFARAVRANARRLDDKSTPKNISKSVSNRLSAKRTRDNGGSPVQRVYIRPTKANPTYHWVFLEYGTVKMAAKPFMRPAFDAQQASATLRAAQVLNKELLKVALR
ncbi:HK97-gp10 family putative phage morphogenesis protein [Advenella mimigardefordensis]|uniref:Putative phage protein, HK97 gp10 family n=1 Tax=Advenella mimigardefordensis (strain DSM 17166 / LMG 22922 / DPN7) TaxID=1247726 RepID=W0P8N5_ADVMD|nr:HK97-gp10 family putative phage morphogenesis protein [Advenella mimigardefordensis]AHG63189.1 putative phage protein, HK97 gp10 family [Advenella mimigardefordensis DPN7]